MTSLDNDAYLKQDIIELLAVIYRGNQGTYFKSI